MPVIVTHSDGFPVHLPTPTPRYMGKRADAIITVPDRPVPLLALAEGTNGFVQLLLQPGGGAAPDPAALVGELSLWPVVMVTDISATDAVRLANGAPDLVNELIRSCRVSVPRRAARDKQL